MHTLRMHDVHNIKKTPRKFRTVISFTDLMTKMTKRSIEI